MPSGEESIDVSALGSTIRISFDARVAPEIVDRVRSVWAAASVATEVRPDRELHVSADEDPEQMLEQLSVRVTLDALDHRRGDLVMFHAAGIATEDGRVVAFVGPSGRGKTTLSRALGTRYGYVSDETVGIDREGRVAPYRKPLSIVSGLAAKIQVSPIEAGLKALPTAPLRLAAIVLLNRDAEHTVPRIDPVPFADALTELVPQLSYLAELDAPLETLVALCARVGGIKRLSYAEIDTMDDLVPLLLEESGATETWWTVEAVPTSIELAPAEGAEAISDGERTVVLIGQMIHVLDGIAPAVWQALSAGLDMEGIVTAVISQHGTPADGDARELIDRAILDMVEAGVLRHR